MLTLFGFYHNGSGYVISGSKLAARMTWFLIFVAITVLLHWKGLNIFNLIKKAE